MSNRHHFRAEIRLALHFTPSTPSGCIQDMQENRLLLEVIDHALDHGLQIVLRLEPDELSNLFDIRAAPAHILEAGAIRLLISNVLDRGTAACHLFHLLRQFVDGHFLVIPHVEHIPLSRRLAHQPGDRVDHIPDVGEASGLVSISINSDRFFPMND